MRTKKMSSKTLLTLGVLTLCLAAYLWTTSGTVLACDDDETIEGVYFCANYNETSNGYRVSLTATNKNSYTVDCSGTVTIKYPGGSKKCLTSWPMEGIRAGKTQSQTLMQTFKKKPTDTIFDIRVTKRME